MAFPLSISGRLLVKQSALGRFQSVMERMAAALSAQTVDTIKVTAGDIEFQPQGKGAANNPRPEGNGWMFDGLGRCYMRVHHDEQGVLVNYHLDCRLQFYIVTIISIGSGALIQSSSGPDHDWGWTFACGLWTVMFFSNYISKTIEFRRWLKTNLTSDALPPIKPLRSPTDPS